MQILSGGVLDEIKQVVKGYFTDDAQTKKRMAEVYEKTGYIMCPHTAVGYDGLLQYKNECVEKFTGVVLSTAHYAKFLPTVESVIGGKVPVPLRLSELLDKEKKSILLGSDFEGFKKFLLG
jgi:threonine synthase